MLEEKNGIYRGNPKSTTPLLDEQQTLIEVAPRKIPAAGFDRLLPLLASN
jgi:hypothetical protein